jgi:hypothetical protein
MPGLGGGASPWSCGVGCGSTHRYSICRLLGLAGPDWLGPRLEVVAWTASPLLIGLYRCRVRVGAEASVTVTMVASANPCGLSITRDATVVAEVTSTSPDADPATDSDSVTIHLQRCHQR